jgi:hypothetical protein
LNGANITPFHAIGQLISAAGTAEASLTTIILRIMGDERGYALTAAPALSGMDFKVKISVLKALVAIRYPKVGGALSKITKQLESAFDARNNVAHAVVTEGRNDNEVLLQFTKINAMGRMRNPEYWTTDKIMNHAHDFQKHCEELDALVTALGVPKFGPLFPKDQKLHNR